MDSLKTSSDTTKQLGQSIYEGACDFITELLLNVKLHHAYLEYGRVHELALKKDFAKEMYSPDYKLWLYN